MMKRVNPVSFHTKHFNTAVMYRTSLPKVLTVVTVFWDATPCSLVEIYRRFDNPENGYSTFIRNGDKFIPDCKISYDGEYV